MRSILLFASLTALACSSGPRVGPIPPAAGESQPAETAQSVSASLAQPLPGDPLGVTIHELDNGLTVMISPEPSEPRVSAWIAFRNGSRHDPADSTGLAHYLEHMLFKGSSRLGTTDIGKEQVHLERIARLYDRLKTAPAGQWAAILAQIDRANSESARYSIPNELDQLYAEMGISGVNAFTGEDMTVYITPGAT